MKKALMVLGLAACTSMVFAQTNKVPAMQSETRQLAKTQMAPQQKTNQYKGSIFSKSIDTIKVWHFGPSQRDSIIYGTSAIVTVNDTALLADTTTLFRTPHGAISESWSRWNLIDSVGMMDNRASAFYTTFSYGTCFLTNMQPNFNYTRLHDYFEEHMQWRLDSADGFNYTEDAATRHGFMLMSRGGATQYTGVTNAYVQFPKVKVPEGAASIDITMLQLYADYYDYCFVEFLNAQNKWQSVMFNINGIDLSVNQFIYGRVNVTLPTSASNLDSLAIRIRYVSNRPDGHFWAIDNVAYEVRTGVDASRWKENISEYVEGYYGIMPKDMPLPLSWYTQVENNGAYARTDVNVTAYHLDANRANPTVIQEATFANIPADSTAYLEVDDRNMYYAGYIASYHGFDGAGHDTTFAEGTTLHSLPVSTTGKQFVTMTTTSKAQGYEQIDTIVGDTMFYSVSDTVTYTVNGITYKGFRWAHDNGILANNSAFTFGYSDTPIPNTDPQRYYVSDTGHYNRNGYAVMSKFVTGQDVPADWRFLGIELVAATTYEEPEVVEGSMIVPQVYWWPYEETEDGYIRYYTIPTGAENYSVSAEDVNFLSNDYYMLESDPNFKHIFIPFPNQPEVYDTTGDNNRIFYIGYKMTADGRFATAAAQSYYWRSSSDYFRFRDSAESRDYVGTKSLSAYDIFVDDGGLFYAGGNASYYPMIRAIVGPYVEIPYDTVMIEGGECDFGDAGEETYMIGADLYNTGRITYFLCDEIAHAVPHGNTQTYYLTAADGYMISQVYIDGELQIPFREGNASADQNPDLLPVMNVWYEMVGNDSVERYREDYTYTFTNISGNHTIRLVAVPWEPTGINTVADNVKLSLRPNPATGVVRISMEGVNGMVDCNIIDMSGRVVYSSKLNAEGENTVNLNSVAPGAYFVRITNSNINKVEKLIVR